MVLLQGAVWERGGLQALFAEGKSVRLAHGDGVKVGLRVGSIGPSMSWDQSGKQK